MNWLYIFLGFSALIILHEAGHFFAAKATGMRVERFFLFFPPKLVSIKRGETEYGIGAIPAGGFVKISGMNPDEVLPEGEEHRGYYEQPVWKRIVVIGAGPAVNIVLAFAIFFFVFLSPGKDTLAAVGFVNVTQTVGEIAPGTPAAESLHQGDRIVAIDGHRYANLSAEERLLRFISQVGSHECAGKPEDGCLAATPAVLTVRRDGQLKTVTVRPEYDAAAGRTRIGFGYGSTVVEDGPVDRSLNLMWRITSGTVSVFSKLFEEERRKEVSGVVGVSDAANQTLDVSTERSFLLLGLVSLSLGLINLFPFLPLDGGHIFWSLVEKVRGKPVPYRVMERAGALGFVLVIMLFFLGLTNDIGRLTGEGFNVR